MQTDLTLYRRDVMAQMLRNHSRLGGKQKFKAIRPTRNGIYYQMFTGKDWKEAYLNHKQIETILGELDGNL